MGIDRHKQNLREYYDQIASQYNIRHGSRLYGTEYNIESNYLPLLRRHLRGDETALEIGSGTGRFSEVLAPMTRRYCALDLSLTMLKQDQGPHWKTAADSERLPFAAETFDVVLGIATFSYYTNKRACLREIRRVLKPGGKLILLDQNFLSPLFYLILLFYSRERQKNINWHLLESNRFILARILRETDFGVVEIEPTSWVPHTLSSGMVRILKPWDKLLSRTPLLRQLAMRIFIVAQK